MSPSEFAHLRAQAEHNGRLLYYAGTFNPNVIQAAADTLKCRLASEDGSSSAKRKLFSTFIEMAQNVLHYAAPLPASDAGASQALGEPVAQGAIGVGRIDAPAGAPRSEGHTSGIPSPWNFGCRLLLEKNRRIGRLSGRMSV